MPLARFDGHFPPRKVKIFPRAPGQAPLSHLNWQDLRARNRNLDGLVGYDWAPMSVATTGEPEVLVGQMVPGDYFDLLQVKAMRGRTFAAGEDGAPGGFRGLSRSLSFAPPRARNGSTTLQDPGVQCERLPIDHSDPSHGRVERIQEEVALSRNDH